MTQDQGCSSAKSRMKLRVPPFIQKAAIIIIALTCLNAGCLLLASRPANIPLAEWRKGPVIHKDSFYGPARAPQYFWLFTAVFIDVYALALWGFMAALRRPVHGTNTRRLLAALAALATAAAVTEGITRWTAARSHPGHFRPHPDVFYYNRPLLRDSREFPNALPESTTSRGFRGKDEIPTAKPPGEYRIFVVGDSSAFGHGVLDHETFSAQLENMLRESVQGPVRVINAACPGHCTHEGLIIYERMGVPLEPDVVIVSYNNDASPEYQEEKTRAPSMPLVQSIMRVFYRSDYFLLFQRTVANALLRLRFRPGAPEPPTVPRVSLEDYAGNLLAFQEKAARHGAKVVFLNMPVNHEFLEQTLERRQFYNPAYPRALLELCRQNGLPVADVDGDQAARQPDVFLPGHHFHPNAQGHRLIAEQVAPILIPMIAERMPLRPRIQPDAAPVKPPPVGAIEGIKEEAGPDEAAPEPADMQEWRRVARIGYSALTPLHALFGETMRKTTAASDAGMHFLFSSFLHGKDQDEACSQGLVDITFSCEAPAMIHLDRHRDLAILGCAGELGDIALVTLKNSTIKNTAGLKGKVIAVADGASAMLMLGQWMEKAGLNLKRDARVSLFKGDGSEAIEALSMGAADAAVLWDPWLTQYTETRPLKTLEKAPFFSLILVSRKYAEARPENLADMLHALRLSLDWARANPVLAELFVAQASGLSRSTVRTVLAKNRFFQPNPPPSFAFEPEIIRRLRECWTFAVQHKLAAPDTPLFFMNAYKQTTMQEPDTRNEKTGN